MKTSNDGQNLIKSFEQLRLVAYMPTPDDVPTIGWGTTKDVKMGDEIDFKTAQAWFERDLQKFEACVSNAIKVEQTQHEFDACVCLAYNIGCQAFANSTLVKQINAQDLSPKTIALQFLRWNKQGGKELRGLTRRRQAERELYLKK